MLLLPGLLLSIALPVLAGLPWMLAAQDRRAPGGWPLAIAYGYVLGLLITIMGMRALHLAHLPISLLTAAILPAIAAAAGCWRMRATLAFARADALAARSTWQALPRATRIVCVGALVLIGLRLANLGVELVLRPIFPWEAGSAVAAKARVSGTNSAHWRHLCLPPDGSTDWAATPTPNRALSLSPPCCWYGPRMRSDSGTKDWSASRGGCWARASLSRYTATCAAPAAAWPTHSA
ncbi:MAG: hypothetical protein IPO58_11230 [Betaproteobacteria bacterium]|nr:hypothetical protein [Betaproteobacteria bacterium]